MSASNILRNWALMPGSEQLLADANCINALAFAVAAVAHEGGPAAAQLTGNVLDVLQQVSILFLLLCTDLPTSDSAESMVKQAG